MIYAKFFPKNLLLRGLKYSLGKNVDPIPFNPDSSLCGPGGIYYTSFDEKMFNFIEYGPIIGFIKIDEGIPIVKVGDDKFKSPNINIIEFKNFKEWCFSDDCNFSEEVQLKAVKNNGFSIQFIKDPSEEFQLAAVKNNGLSIEFIKDPSEEIKIAAVKNHGWSIQYIKNPSKEVQLAAVK